MSGHFSSSKSEQNEVHMLFETSELKFEDAQKRSRQLASLLSVVGLCTADYLSSVLFMSAEALIDFCTSL